MKQESVLLAWSDFQATTLSFLSGSQQSAEYSDVTLACEGDMLVPAHRLVLAAGSTFFEALLRRVGGQGRPVVYLRGVEARDLEALLTFLYMGEARVAKERLEGFLILARDLGVRGFQGDQGEGEVKAEKKLVENNDGDKIEDDSGKDSAWKYFTKMDGVNSICNLCDKVYSTKGGTTTSIRKHLVKAHNKNSFATKTYKEEVLNESCTYPQITPETNGDNFPKEIEVSSTNLPELLENSPKAPTKSPVWLFAEKLDKDNGKCKFCEKVVNAFNGTTSGMKRHLLKYHSDNTEVVEAFAARDAYINEDSTHDENMFPEVLTLDINKTV